MKSTEIETLEADLCGLVNLTTPRSCARSIAADCLPAIAELRALRAQHDDLVAALREVYSALKKDAADPDTGGDVTVYRLDGGAMYKAINTVRAALAKAGAA